MTSARASSGAAFVVVVGLLSVGCGAYEPEPEFPEFRYVAPTPASSAELAARRRAQPEAVDDDASEYSDTDPSALTEFRTALEGHGSWIDDASYGTVWLPSREEVGVDFQPYVTAGHWTYSDDTDYVWVSDYSWGWAPFHYGRWVYLPSHGWAWIPGRRYAGAWVTWRVGPAGYGYVGWAPAPPTWYWRGGVARSWSFGWYRYDDHYVYCPRGDVHRPALAAHVVRGPAAREHDGRTHDYVPARPGIGGDDRFVARPSVRGDDRLLARPSVGGRVTAKPVIGPRPDEPVRPSPRTFRPSSPVVRPTPVRPSPVVRPPPVRPSPVRPMPVRPSPPTFRPSSPAVRPPSRPSPSFRSSAPAVRARPSVRASPSVRSAPAVRARPGIRTR